MHGHKNIKFVKIKVASCMNFGGKDVRRRCSSISFATSALQCGGWSAPHRGRRVVTLLIVRRFLRTFPSSRRAYSLGMWVYVMPEELYYAFGTRNDLAQLVEALRYKAEGRGFDSLWCHSNFSLP